MIGFFQRWRLQTRSTSLTHAVHDLTCEVSLLRHAILGSEPSERTLRESSDAPSVESPESPTSPDWLNSAKKALGLLPRDAEAKAPWHTSMSDETAWEQEQAALPMGERLDPFSMMDEENNENE